MAQEEEASGRRVRAGALAAEAKRLGMEAVEECAGDPLVISGTVDGVAFTMHERGGEYTIVAAGLSVAPGVGHAQGDVFVLARGTSANLYSDGSADTASTLRFIVSAVRTVIRRQACTHPVRRSLRYCPKCGTALVDPALP